MYEYGKTENLFARDPDSHELTSDWRMPTFMQVEKWLVTEKIDGTNIRIGLEWEEGIGGQTEFLFAPADAPDDGMYYSPIVSVRGRTDEAALPGKAGYFYNEALGWDAEELEWRVLGALSEIMPTWKKQPTPTEMVIFGEGYGPGIQKGGGNYARQKSLRLFDVVTIRESGKYWRPWQDVQAVADVLNLATVPVIAYDMPTDDVIRYIDEPNYAATLSIVSRLENPDAYEESRCEGVVARTDPYLFDGHGNRVMFKHKF